MATLGPTLASATLVLVLLSICSVAGLQLVISTESIHICTYLIGMHVACRMQTPHIHTGNRSFSVDTRPNFKIHQDDPRTSLTQACTHTHKHTPVNGSQAITELRSAFGNLPPATVSRFVSMPLSPAPDHSHPKPLILDFSLCVYVCVCVCVCVALSASACEECRCLRPVHHGEAMTPFVFLQPTPRAQLCAGSSARCGVCARECGACVRAQSLAFGLLLPVCLFVCLSR
jgi:hypothetical protein